MLRSPELKLRERFDTFCLGLVFFYLRWHNFLKALIAKQMVCLDEIDHKADRISGALGIPRGAFEDQMKTLDISSTFLRKELDLDAKEIEELAKQIVFYPEPFKRIYSEAIVMIWWKKRQTLRRISFREALGTVILLKRAALEIGIKTAINEFSRARHDLLENLRSLRSLSRIICESCPDRDTCPDRE